MNFEENQNELLRNNGVTMPEESERESQNDSTEQQSNGSEETSGQTVAELEKDLIDSDGQVFSTEYDRKSPARVTLSHLKSKIFTTEIIFENIPGDDAFFELNKQIEASLPKNEDARSDAYFEFAKSRISGVKGYLIPDGKTWRDIVPEGDITNAFTKLVMVGVEPRGASGDDELYNPLAPVAMDVKFFDNSGVEVAKEISFKPVTRAQLKEFKYIKLDKPNPNALASNAKKDVFDRLRALTKEIFDSANYADVPAWHIMQAGLTYLEIEQAQSGKF